jgi:hypothetical protein
MPRFDEALRAAATSLDLPQPDRARILEEIAVDLEDLRAELVRRGVSPADAEARAVELLVPSDVAARALVEVHEPLYRSLARRFSPSVMRRWERLGLAAITVTAVAAVAVPLATSGVLRDPSPFLVPILALLAGMLAVAGRKAIQLFVEQDHTPELLRSGMVALLLASGLSVVAALAGLAFELYRLAVSLEATPDRMAALAVTWILDTSVLVGAGLATALVGGICWFLLHQKIEAVERAHRSEASVLGSTRPTTPTLDPHPFTPNGALP